MRKAGSGKVALLLSRGLNAVQIHENVLPGEPSQRKWKVVDWNMEEHKGSREGHASDSVCDGS